MFDSIIAVPTMMYHLLAAKDGAVFLTLLCAGLGLVVIALLTASHPAQRLSPKWDNIDRPMGVAPLEQDNLRRLLAHANARRTRETKEIFDDLRTAQLRTLADLNDAADTEILDPASDRGTTTKEYHVS